MNPISVREARSLFEEMCVSVKNFSKVIGVVCPPSIYINELLQGGKSKIFIGSQDCFPGEVGPHTGEISVGMLKKAGVRHVIVGHSERRVMGENDEHIKEKIKSALTSKLTVILCVGELVRDDTPEYLNFIRGQLFADLSKITKNLLKNLVIAYEPIWAIGKNAVRFATTQDVTEVSLFIKKILSEMFGREVGMGIPIIYGGSVDINNCRDFLKNAGVEGLLVGRESLNPKRFVEIIEIANEL